MTLEYNVTHAYKERAVDCPSTMQASGAAQQMMGVEAFPELAAMEAEFQASLARGNRHLTHML